MRELPYSISVLFYTESLSMLETVKLAHSIAQIAGFSLKLERTLGSVQDGVQHKEYSLVSHHTDVQRELETKVYAFEQISPDIVPFKLTVGRQNTAVGTKYLIDLSLPQNLPPTILDQLDDFMMALIIAADRFIKLGICVICSITDQLGDCVIELPFALYRSELLNMFEK